jgi:AraC-like DNA-binding protein/quercetin dioxygenase-like cupin family protein
VLAATTRLTDRRIDGAPVYEYVRRASAPSVSVLRFSSDQLLVAPASSDHGHAHDFLVLAYFESGEGSLRLGDRHWPVNAGDAFVIAPGEVVRVDHADITAAGWCVFFPPDLIASYDLGWRSHPLLFPFIARTAGGARRLPVPAAEHGAWSQHVAAIERELDQPRDGSSEAALAHLTLLLVSAARISVDVGNDLRLSREPLLAAVFELIEHHYAEPISLSTIAVVVGLTPGHLTTVVRRKTGRSVQRWITERRMAEARGLLRDTDLTVEAVATAVGYRQPSYFIRQFRRDHTVTPGMWRRQARATTRGDARAPIRSGP